MTVIAGAGLGQPTPELSDTVAARDVVQVNAAGQHVVVVPAGQRIPVHLLDAPEAKAVREAEVEDKAVKAPAARKRRTAKAAE